MTRRELKTLYFDWMCGQIHDEQHFDRRSYYKLLHFLRDTEFTYPMVRDGNRADDGIDLRYQFGDEESVDMRIIATYLDDRPCSVLEMMIALAIRCEVHIMSDSDIGDRTAQWFWGMVDSLGLGRMDDSRFNENHADDILKRFLNREYEPNGRGGLFTIDLPGQDLRDVEIWYQLCWYLNSIV